MGMAISLIDTLFDLVSAASGALVGAIVTGLFNRNRRRQLSDQVVLGRQELEKVKLDNERLLGIIRDREETIMKMEMQILGRRPTKKRRK